MSKASSYLRYKSNTEVHVDPGHVKGWDLSCGPEIHIFPRYGWVSGIVPIAGVDPDGSRLLLDQDHVSRIFGGGGFLVWEGNRFFVENAREELDAPAVWMIGATHCRIRQCLFRNIGGWALTIRSGSFDSVFEGNTVTQAGMGGVYLDGGEDGNLGQLGPPEARPRRNLISGNHMHHGGRVFAHVAGVYLCDASDNVVRHNLVHHWPRYGLSIKYQSGGNVYEYNRVHHTNLETNDTGGIEIYNNFQGSTVQYNIVGDTMGLQTTAAGDFVTPHYSWGIYLDGMTSNATVRGNIVFRNVLGGVMLNGGSHCTIVNNILVEAEKAQVRFNNYQGTGKGNTFLRNIVYYEGAQAHTYNSTRHQSGWLQSDQNLLYHAGGDLTVQLAPAVPNAEGSWAAWRSLGQDTHSVVADPLSVNPADDDYRLDPDSPAFGLGFKPIPVDKIGLAGAPVRPPAWHSHAGAADGQ